MSNKKCELGILGLLMLFICLEPVASHPIFGTARDAVQNDAQFPSEASSFSNWIAVEANGDSRLNLALNYTHEKMQTFPLNEQISLTWQKNSGAGNDLALGDDAKTITFRTAGTYVLRLRWGMSSAEHHNTKVNVLCNMSDGAIVGGDTIQSSIPLPPYGGDGTDTWLWRMNSGATLVMGAEVGGGDGPEKGYDITLDIVKIAN